MASININNETHRKLRKLKGQLQIKHTEKDISMDEVIEELLRNYKDK